MALHRLDWVVNPPRRCEKDGLQLQYFLVKSNFGLAVSQRKAEKKLICQETQRDWKRHFRASFKY